MTALMEVGCHVPDLSVDIGEIGAAVGAGTRTMWTFRRFFGLSAVRRAPDQDLRELLTAAVRSLEALRGNEHRVRYVIFGRTVSTVSQAGEHPVEELCAELGLVNASPSRSPSTPAPAACWRWTWRANCWPGTAIRTRWPWCWRGRRSSRRRWR